MIWQLMAAFAGGTAVGVGGTLAVQEMTKDKEVEAHKKRLEKAKKEADKDGVPRAVICDMWPSEEQLDKAIKMAEKDPELADALAQLKQAKAVRKEGTYSEKMGISIEFEKQIAEDDETLLLMAENVAKAQEKDPFEESKKEDGKKEKEAKKEEPEVAGASA